jgi:hypothetical protein
MKKIAIAVVSLASFLFAGCETTQPKVESKPAPILKEIKIFPDNPVVYEGSPIELDAKGIDQYNNPFVITPVWAVTKGNAQTGILNMPKVAGDKAIFNGKKEGKVTIEATQNGIKGSTIIEVTKVTAVKAGRSFK